MQEYTLKKSLGQHFLKDENVCRKIVEALLQEHFTQLLEVGAGAGALTKYLLQIPNINFKAVELDKEKVLFLEKKFPAVQGKIINESILNTAIPFDNAFAVIGNFPYNISSQILFRLLEWKPQISVIIGMFQKEVAQRIAADSGSKTYGILSVLVQAFYEVTYLFNVSASCFNPPPKVMSGVVRLKQKKRTFAMQSEDAFFTLVKTAFNQRRKTLRNAVKPLFDADALEGGIFDKRAEQLSVEDFAALSFKMKKSVETKK